MSEDDTFDQSISSSFHGTGKRRTELSGLFLVTIDKLFQIYGYRAVTAWEDGLSIIACVEKPDDTGFWQGMGAIYITEVQSDMQTAAREFVESYIDNDLSPPPYLMLSDTINEYVALVEAQQPDTIPVMKELYGKHWQSAVAEVGSYLTFGVVQPHWLYIQDVLKEGDSLIFVHKEQRRRWRLGDPVTATHDPTASDEMLPPGGSTKLQ